MPNHKTALSFTPFNKYGLLDKEREAINSHLSQLPITQMLREGKEEEVLRMIQSQELIPNAYINTGWNHYEPVLLGVLLNRPKGHLLFLADALWEKGAFIKDANWGCNHLSPEAFPWLSHKLEASGMPLETRQQHHAIWLKAQLDNERYESALSILDLPIDFNKNPELFECWITNISHGANELSVKVVHALLDRYAEQGIRYPGEPSSFKTAPPLPGVRSVIRDHKPIAWVWLNNMARQEEWVPSDHRYKENFTQNQRISARLFGEFDVSINEQDKAGQTALHILANDFPTHDVLLREVVKLGADPFLPDHKGNLPGEGTVLAVLRQQWLEEKTLNSVAQETEKSLKKLPSKPSHRMT